MSHRMFSASRGRRVNLSGRQAQPNALAVAAARRIQRQRNEKALKYVLLCQRLRKGAIGRRAAHTLLRADFDHTRTLDPDCSGPSTLELQRSRLGIFIDPTSDSDLDRLQWFLEMVQIADLGENRILPATLHGYSRLHRRLLTLATLTKPQRLSRQSSVFDGLTDATISTCTNFVKRIKDLTCILPFAVNSNSDLYYQTLARILKSVLGNARPGCRPTELISTLMDAVTAPLSIVSMTINTIPSPSSATSFSAICYYSSFALFFLSDVTVSNTSIPEAWFNSLSTSLDCRLVTWALVQRGGKGADSSFPLSLRSSSFTPYNLPVDLDESQRFSLLGFIVFLHANSPLPIATRMASQLEFPAVVSSLLASVIDHPILQSFQSSHLDSYSSNLSAKAVLKGQEDHQLFVKKQLEALATQQQIRALFNPTLPTTSLSAKGKELKDQSKSTVASNPSNESLFRAVQYVLTMINCFSKQGDQIRIWAYLSEATYTDKAGALNTTSLIRALCEISLQTEVVVRISLDPKNAIALCPPMVPSQSLQDWSVMSLESCLQTQNDWRVILLFLEIYSFVVKVIDDDEFRSGGSSTGSSSVNKQAAIPLSEVSSLAAFLRNLAFSLYFSSPTIISTLAPIEPGSDTRPTSSKKLVSSTTFIDGLKFDYVRGVVTGVTRTLHDRDSRWPFLPEGFWLMSEYFSLDGLIPDIVTEEDRRRSLFGEDDDDDDDGPDQWSRRGGPKTDNRSARVGPGLDILENLPFLIPFRTRALIFRQFIEVDHSRARRPITIGPGFEDEFRTARPRRGPSSLQMSWRQNRPFARVTRGSEFEDAFRQLIDCNEDFRQPFLVEFIDQFQMQEAGIDGGGVTKEFLLAATKQALESPVGPPLFIGTENHLMYPNPTILDEMRDEPDAYLDLYNLDPTTSARTKTLITNILLRYELLGLLLGKCLYDGILLNYEFAGFFLIKWALAGGNGGSSIGESGYRATVNDLRELDAGLYQSLLKVKNYPDDVTNLCLTFVSSYDVPNRINGTSRRAVVPLRPDGAEVEVTNDTRLQYISYIARNLLQSRQQAQTTAFLRGLSRLIMPNWLSMFNRLELQMLVGGASGAEIDLADLRKNTEYSGVYAIGDDRLEHRTVLLFWKVLEESSDQVKQSVVQFVTSSPRAPLLGFQGLNPKFTIRDSGNDQERLPSASTCVNLLKLPIYTTEETLRKKLYAAAESGAGFDLS